VLPEGIELSPSPLPRHAAVLQYSEVGRASTVFGGAVARSAEEALQISPQVSTERNLAAVDQPRQLFLDSGYEPRSIVTNSKTSGGDVLVSKGEDADKHATLLRLAAA
jgi:hypothetical protein